MAQAYVPTARSPRTKEFPPDISKATNSDRNPYESTKSEKTICLNENMHLEECFSYTPRAQQSARKSDSWQRFVSDIFFWQNDAIFWQDDAQMKLYVIVGDPSGEPHVEGETESREAHIHGVRAGAKKKLIGIFISHMTIWRTARDWSGAISSRRKRGKCGIWKRWSRLGAAKIGSTIDNFDKIQRSQAGAKLRRSKSDFQENQRGSIRIKSKALIPQVNGARTKGVNVERGNCGSSNQQTV